MGLYRLGADFVHLIRWFTVLGNDIIHHFVSESQRK